VRICREHRKDEQVVAASRSQFRPDSANNSLDTCLRIVPEDGRHVDQQARAIAIDGFAEFETVPPEPCLASPGIGGPYYTPHAASAVSW
jgi:hypothetical protein